MWDPNFWYLMIQKRLVICWIYDMVVRNTWNWSNILSAEIRIYLGFVWDDGFDRDFVLIPLVKWLYSQSLWSEDWFFIFWSEDGIIAVHMSLATVRDRSTVFCGSTRIFYQDTRANLTWDQDRWSIKLLLFFPPNQKFDCYCGISVFCIFAPFTTIEKTLNNYCALSWCTHNPMVSIYIIGKDYQRSKMMDWDCGTEFPTDGIV